MFVTLIKKNISRCAYLTNFLISQVCFFFWFVFSGSMLFPLWNIIITVTIVIVTNCSIITIIYVINKLVLSSLLPLFLVLYFFCYYQYYYICLLLLFIFIAAIVIKLTLLLLSLSLASLISKSTLILFICEFQPLKCSFKQQFFSVHRKMKVSKSLLYLYIV